MVQREELYKQMKAVRQPISALEARKMASKNISGQCQLELQAAMNAIYEAVDDGKGKCWCYTFLHDQCLSELRKLGYEVNNYSTQRDGDAFEISWQ